MEILFGQILRPAFGVLDDVDSKYIWEMSENIVFQSTAPTSGNVQCACN